MYGPGVNSTYEYANENFIILSYLIEKLSGISLQMYFRTKIFEPLGLSSTVFDPFGKAFQLVQSPAEEYYYFSDLNVGPQPFAISSCSNTGCTSSRESTPDDSSCPSFRGGSGCPKRQRRNNQVLSRKGVVFNRFSDVLNSTVPDMVSFGSPPLPLPSLPSNFVTINHINNLSIKQHQ